MKDPHNYRAVGWSMVVIAASLAIIGLIALSPMGADPYFSDRILKKNLAEFHEAKEKAAELQNKTTGLQEKIPIAEKTGGMFILSAYLK